MARTKRNVILWTMGTVALAGSMLAGEMLAAGALSARAPAAQAPTTKQFEVASVKINKSGDNRVLLGLQPGGRFTASNLPLRNLITNAYRIQGTQLVGGPSWIGTERFDIVAKAEGDATPDDVNLMVRALLADRFGLVVHPESREVPIYALLLARPDGKLGDKIKPSSVDCEAEFGRGRGQGAMPPAPVPGAPMRCGMRIGPGVLNAGSTTLAQLANSLGLNVGRIVQDKTGLEGRFDVELSWTPEGRGGPGGGPFGGGAAGTPAPLPSDGSGVSIFTAVQEQLGLKLESQRGNADVLVIDSVSMPTPD